MSVLNQKMEEKGKWMTKEAELQSKKELKHSFLSPLPTAAMCDMNQSCH